MNEITRIIGELIEKSNQVTEIEDKIKTVKNKNVKFEILKSPRWIDDAIILKATIGTQKYIMISIH